MRCSFRALIKFMTLDTSRFLSDSVVGTRGSHVTELSLSAMEPPGGERTVKRIGLKDYDACGFDLDHTLAIYKLQNLFHVNQ